MKHGKPNILVIALSTAGVFFILLGLAGLAVPESREGVRLWQLNTEHSVHMMDLAGTFMLGVGLVLTWLGGKYWNQHVLS